MNRFSNERGRSQIISIIALVAAVAVLIVVIIFLLRIKQKEGGDNQEISVGQVQSEFDSLSQLEEGAVAFVKAWNRTMCNHDLISLEDYYLPNCRYYTRRCSVAEIIASKQRSFEKYPLWTSTITDIVVESLAEDVVRVSYVKESDHGNGDVPKPASAYLDVEYHNGKWHIVTESDPKTDTNSSKKLNGEIGGMQFLAEDASYDYYKRTDGSVYRRNKGNGLVEAILKGGIDGVYVSSINGDNKNLLPLSVPSELHIMNERRLVLVNYDDDIGYGPSLAYLDPLSGRGLSVSFGKNPRIEYRDGVPFLWANVYDMVSGSYHGVYYDIYGRAI